MYTYSKFCLMSVLETKDMTFNNKASACNFTKSNTPPRVFLTFLKLYKWYQIAQKSLEQCN